MPEDTVSVGERALGELLERAHLVQPDSLLALVSDAASTIGATEVRLLLVDHGQERLVPFPPFSGEEGLPVDSTLPGEAFRTLQIRHALGDGGARRVWVPLVDGVDRLGVFGATLPTVPDPELTLARLVRLASATAHIIVSKSNFGDLLARAARRRPMSLAAEMQWSLLPPLTVATERVAVSAMLEPSYDVGGDLVDYAVHDDVLQAAVLDAKGHGLPSSLLASLAVGAYRNRRRAGQDLRRVALAMEEALAEQFADEPFVAALLLELDLETGRLRWLNAGQPPPLLLRAGRLEAVLDDPPDRPLGIGLNAELRVRERRLEPRDRLLLHTDGVADARDAAGRMFGVERLARFVAEAPALEPPAETMRRLSKAVLAHQASRAADDATHAVMEWRPAHLQRLTP